MLVTFRTKAYANITMFGDVAVALLQMMGHSGTVPSALRADDVPAALERLKKAVGEHRRAAAGTPGDDSGEDGEAPVSLANRAHPLIALLEAAAAKQADVLWS